MTDYLYANLSIGKDYEEGRDKPAPQANDSGGWDYVGLSINAKPATQPAPAANGNDYEYVGLAINNNQTADKPAKRQLQYFQQKTGYCGRGAK